MNYNDSHNIIEIFNPIFVPVYFLNAVGDYGNPTGQHNGVTPQWAAVISPQIRWKAYRSGFSSPFHFVTAKIAMSFDRPSVEEDAARCRGNGPSPRQREQLQRQVWHSEVYSSLYVLQEVPVCLFALN